jgi:nucleoside phosphorylase
MLEAALAEERHRGPEDPLPRDGLAMSPLRHEVPALVVVFHALSVEAAAVSAPGWRVTHCAPQELEPPREPTLAWLRTGIGPAAARNAVERLPQVAIRAAILAGFAGGLAPGLAPGTLVVADPLLDSKGRQASTPLAREVFEAARAAGLGVERGPLVTVSEVAATTGEKARLHAAHGALAVDMESAVLATALAERSIPAAAVRVVLDTADEAVPVSAGALLRSPRLLVAGVRIALRMRRCTAISGRLLEAWLERLARGAEPGGRDHADRDRDAEQRETR